MENPDPEVILEMDPRVTVQRDLVLGLLRMWGGSPSMWMQAFMPDIPEDTTNEIVAVAAEVIGTQAAIQQEAASLRKTMNAQLTAFDEFPTPDEPSYLG